MSRKILWLILASAALLLVACAKEPEPTATPRPTRPTPTEEPTPVDEGPCAPTTDGPLAGVDPREVELHWWYSYPEAFEEELLPLVAEFNQNNECGIQVVTENQGADLWDKMNAGVAAKELPGLVVGDQTDQAFYVQGGGLADLDLYINDSDWGLGEKELADFYAVFLEQGVHRLFDSQRAGFPLSRAMEVIYYNQTWLEELGFDGPPTTPEAFQEMACAGAEANRDGTGGLILPDGAAVMAAWTQAFGGDVVAETGNGYLFHGGATLRALNLLQEMVDEGCARLLDEGYPDLEFAARRALFTQGSSSDLPYYADAVASAAAETGNDQDLWGVAAIPHTTADPVQIVSGDDLMIPVTTPETQLAAWIFVKWLTAPEMQAEWVPGRGSLPTRASTVEHLEDTLSENPQWEAILGLLPYASYEPPLISYRAVGGWISESFNEIMQGADSREVLSALTGQANQLQAELMEGPYLVNVLVPPVQVAEPCEPATDGPLADVDPRGMQLVWWHAYQGDREDLLQALIEIFNSTNECGIVVTPERQRGLDQLAEQMVAAITDGELPDLVVGDQIDQAVYARDSSLVDMTSYLDDEHWGLGEEVDDFYAAPLAQGVQPAFDEARLGFPLDRSMELLYYNLTWLEELGFDEPPMTPEEFEEMACAAAEENDDGTGGYLLQGDATALAAWTLAFGGKVLDRDGTGYVYNRDATLDALTLLTEMVDGGCASVLAEESPPAELAARRAVFTQGSSSEFLAYQSAIESEAEEAERDPDEWGVMAFPHTTADPAPVIHGPDLMIPVTTPEAELAAWILITWFSSPEIQAEWVQVDGDLPARAATAELLEAYEDENPQWAVALELLPHAAYEPPLISYRAVSDLVEEALNAIMQGEDIEETLDALTAAANDLQEELMSEGEEE